MISKACIFLPLLFSCLYAKGQNMDPIIYMDQNVPDTVAHVFAPGKLSTNAIEHSSPAFSPDGKTVFWAIMEMPSYQTILREMNFDGTKWSAPHSPSFGNSMANEVYPNFSTDGDTLYFSSDRSPGSTAPRTNTLWYAVRNSVGWSQAKVLDQRIYDNDIYASSSSKTGNRYFTRGLQGSSDWNIYKADSRGDISPIASHINTAGYEDGPFIAPDESYLIFESDRPTGVEGNIDLYIAFRRKDGTWGEPMNMGPRINTASAERFARVSPDGKYLFFGRNIGQGFDIYWISANIIADLKSNAIK
jgi:Tol biopolymer transport system component